MQLLFTEPDTSYSLPKFLRVSRMGLSFSLQCQVSQLLLPCTGFHCEEAVAFACYYVLYRIHHILTGITVFRKGGCQTRGAAGIWLRGIDKQFDLIAGIINTKTRALHHNRHNGAHWPVYRRWPHRGHCPYADFPWDWRLRIPLVLFTVARG